MFEDLWGVAQWAGLEVPTNVHEPQWVIVRAAANICTWVQWAPTPLQNTDPWPTTKRRIRTCQARRRCEALI